MNINKIFKRVALLFRRIYMMSYQKIHGINTNKVVISSFGGKQYSDSGRNIGEKLHEIDKNIEIVWILDEKAIEDEYKIIPDYIIKVPKTTKNVAKQISTCGVYITNENMPPIYKNKKQLFIDTWHGDRAFKKIAYDKYENGEKPAIPIYDNKVTDLCIAASTYGENVYRSAFKYRGKIINVGMPRNDVLIEKSKTDSIRNRLNLENKKVLLYAPTFRDNNKDIQNIKIDFNKILDVLQKKEGGEWVLITRSHTMSKGVKISADKNKIIDLTDYPDVADILQITDFLITDYSSVATDYALTQKPIILFMYDYEEYKNVCRGFKADPKETGFIYAETEDELLSVIKNTSKADFAKSCKKVNEYYGTNETGKSTEIICNYITDWMKNNRA